MLKKIIIGFLSIIFFISCNVLNVNVNKENYNKLKKGMSSEQIINILGNPGSKTESNISGMGKMEYWHYQLGGKAIDVTLRRGKLSTKSWTQI